MGKIRIKFKAMFVFVAIIVVFMCSFDNFGFSDYDSNGEIRTITWDDVKFSPVFWTQYKQLTSTENTNKVYKVDIEQNNEDAIYLKITENDQGLSKNRQNGGSYFIINQQQGIKLQRRTICPFTDYFNGTYSVKCPYYDSEFSDITVMVQFSSFAAFQKDSMADGRNETIFVRRVYRPLSYSMTTLLHSLSKLIRIGQPPLHSWRTDLNSQCTHFERKGRMIDQMENDEIRKCLGHYQNVVIIGSSDMKELAEFLTETFSNSPQTQIQFVPVKNSSFLLQMVESSLVKWKETVNWKIAVWIQISEEYVTSYGLEDSVSHATTEIGKTLQILKGYSHIDLKLLGYFPSQVASSSRTVQAGVFNSRLFDISERLGIDFSDIYEYAYPCLLKGQTIFQNQEYISRVKNQLYQRGFLSHVCKVLDQELNRLQ